MRFKINFSLILCLLISSHFTDAQSESSQFIEFQCKTPEQRKNPEYDFIWESPLLAEQYKSTYLSEEWYYLQLKAALKKLNMLSPSSSETSQESIIEAVKKFQEKINVESTGMLRICEWLELVKRSKISSQRFIKPGNLNFEPLDIHSNSDRLNAVGSWKLVNDQSPPSSLETSTIFCDRKERKCIEAFVKIYKEVDLEDDVKHSYFRNKMINWSITKWNKHEIKARLVDCDCFEIALNYNIDEDKLYKIIKYNKADDFLPECRKHKRLEPAIYQLVDSFKDAKSYYDNQVYSGSYDQQWHTVKHS